MWARSRGSSAAGTSRSPGRLASRSPPAANSRASNRKYPWSTRSAAVNSRKGYRYSPCIRCSPHRCRWRNRPDAIVAGSAPLPRSTSARKGPVCQGSGSPTGSPRTPIRRSSSCICPAKIVSIISDPSNWDLIETNGFFRVQSVNLFDSVIELDKIAKVTNLILRTIGCLMYLFIGEFRDKNRKNL